MTRTVADAALMMRELSKPDDRDTMNLPPQDIPWLDLDHRAEGPADRPRPRRRPRHAGRARGRGARSRTAAKRFADARRGRRADARRSSTRADARRARSLLAPARLGRHRRPAARGASQGAALHPRMGRGRARRCPAREVYDGLSQMLAIKSAAIAACRRFDFVLSPVAPVAGLRGRARLAARRPGAPVRAHRLHGAVQLSRSSRRRRSTPATRRRGCRSGCRSSAAASTISASCGWRMPSRRSAPHSGPGLCERKDKRRFASSCAGSRIAFHSPGSSPGCVAGVRESAVEGFGRSSLHCFPGRMQRKRNATRDPAQDSAAKRRRLIWQRSPQGRKLSA